MALDVFVAQLSIRFDQILGHLFVSILGNEKQGPPIIDCHSIAKLSEKEGQVLRVAIIIDRQLLRRRLEEFRV
jgi:hypothetical protein